MTNCILSLELSRRWAKKAKEMLRIARTINPDWDKVFYGLM